MSNTESRVVDSTEVYKSMLTNLANTIKVADVARVVAVDIQDVQCESLSTGVNIRAARTAETIRPGDIVLIVFCDRDFRQNLNRIKNGQPIQKQILSKDKQNTHSNTYAVVATVLYVPD